VLLHDILPAASRYLEREQRTRFLDENEPFEELEPQILADRIRRGDRGAESELVRRYSRPLMTMLRHRTRNVQRAEDLHQDTFVIVLQRLRTTGLDDPTRIAAFLHKTAINLLIDQGRREARRKTSTDTDVVYLQSDGAADQLRALIRDEADRAVRTMILELRNPRDRELLHRFYILQQEKPLVCQAMTLPSEHFDRVISRARKRFRELIEGKRADIALSDDDP
jgi:RNA polymerase sigma-70 factor (ECF subfamily)